MAWKYVGGAAPVYRPVWLRHVEGDALVGRRVVGPAGIPSSFHRRHPRLWLGLTANVTVPSRVESIEVLVDVARVRQATRLPSCVLGARAQEEQHVLALLALMVHRPQITANDLRPCQQACGDR